MKGLFNQTPAINEMLARYGVKFGIYKNGVFKEQLFPFDSIPRVISHQEFSYLNKGLQQRVSALNLFLADIYGEKKIVRDGIIPEEFIFSSSGFLAQCDGVKPVKGVFSHISGIDLVQARDGQWYVLEDNLRVPSGASYPMMAREICRKASPDTFRNIHIADNRNYATMLKAMMDNMNTGGINVVLTPGRFNAAFFEHSFLAEKTKSVLATGNDLFVENDYLWYKGYNGQLQKVGALYRRISDEYLDPMNFCEDSVIGIPHLFEVYKKGNVALVNAPGNGIADDKGIYYFVPKMVKYYLDEEPILKNAPTYLLYYEDDMKYTLDNFDKLVIKDVAEAGGYGVVFGRDLSGDKRDGFIKLIKSEPRRFIAQEIIDFIDLEVMDNGKHVPRKADLRAFVLTGGPIEDEKKTQYEERLGVSVKVWNSGLTRFSRNPDSFVVNSSQGGGFKDTWVLSQ